MKPVPLAQKFDILPNLISGYMKSLPLLLTLFISTASIAQALNTRFEKIKSELFNQPYSELPQYNVNKQLFGPEKVKGGQENENKLINAARRTFDSSEDLITLETQHKLLNANGICFAGAWRINQDSDYTGLYTNGSVTPAIVRASVALSGTKQNNKRSFGMAIKLLPNDLQQKPSLNAFVLHSMGGTVTKYVLDLALDNQPPLGSIPKLSDITTALRLRRDLEKADKENGATSPSVSYRPVSVFAEHQVEEQNVIAPRWLKLTVIDSQRVDFSDFRDELRVENYSHKKIIYQIAVAGNSQDTTTKKKNAKWQTIGVLELTESVTSASCDTNLHFQHPKL